MCCDIIFLLEYRRVYLSYNHLWGYHRHVLLAPRHDTFRGGVISPRRLRFVLRWELAIWCFVVGGVWVDPSFLFCSVLRIGDVCAKHTFRFYIYWIRGPMCVTCLCGIIWLAYVALFDLSVWQGLFWARYEITLSHLISAYYFIVLVLFVSFQFVSSLFI